MKKITFYLFALFCLAFSWQGQSQIFIDESLDSGVPADWTSTYYNASTSADNLCEGTGNLYNNLYYSTWDDLATNGDLTTPNYSGISNGTDTAVEFEWNARPYTTNAVDYIIYVDYSTNDGTDWNLISSFAVTETTACTQYSEVIPAASLPSGSDFKFRVRGEWVSGDSYFYIDNIYITQAISCPQPSDLSVSNVESTQADLSWVENGSASSYNVEVVIAGDTPTGSATDTGVANPFTKTGLTADTAYDFYVQADCTGGDLSAWVGPVSFITGYCIPESSASGTYTNSFTVTGALMNTSTSETGYTGTGYADYYDTNIIESFEGGSFDFSAAIEGGTAGYAVWVDWNNDLVFDAETETVYNTTSYGNGPFEATIAIPSGTALGDYRLRTMVDFSDSNPNDDACAFGNTRGEVEDYKLTIVAAPTDEMDFNNVQWVTDGTNGSDTSLSVDAGTSITVYAQGYEAGVTDSEGAGAGVECWIAINDEDTDPATWDSSLWKVATFGSDSGNNDEYAYTTSDTPPGTNYVAARWRLNNASYTYGGFNGTWDGTNNVNIELIVAPVANDDCDGAIALIVNADLECTETTAGTIQYATASGDDEATCSGTENDDVWFSFVATAESHKIDLLNVTGAPTDLYHSVWSGACGTLTNVSCSDSDSSSATGLTIGETYLLRVNSYGTVTNPTTAFDICIGTFPPPPANDDCAGAEALTIGVTVSGTTDGATGASSTSCNASIGNDVWYTVVGDGGDLTITVNSLDEDSQIGVFESDDCSGITLGSCDYSIDPFDNPAALTFTSVAGTKYYIQVGAWINTGDPSTHDITVETTLSTDSFETESAFTYYPNPVKNTLSLNAQNTIEQVAMYNMLGQEVLRATPNTVDSDLDMSHLQTGTYFVKVTIANVTKTIRVIKQ